MKKPRNPARRLLGQILALGALISAVTLMPIRPASAQEVARSWSYTGNLNMARSGHSATLLPDGKVLVVKAPGYDDFTSAELFDPSTGTWSLTGRMNVPRYSFTATLLPNGKVLVVGGDTYSSTGSAEVYDPATGTWSLTGNPLTPRIFHTATLLWNGKVLVAGGDDGKGGEEGNPLNTAELYDPQRGTWSSTGNLNEALVLHTATLLQDGRLLVIGGANYSYRPVSTQVYDPDAGSWSSVGDLSPNRYRSHHTSTLLPDGRVLIIGSLLISDNVVNTAELYDPKSGRLSNTGPLNFSRTGYTATVLTNGKVLVAGGERFGSLFSSELYDPATGTWSFTDNLNTARSSHTTTLLYDGKVLIAGGSRSSGGYSYALDSVELGYNFGVLATLTPNITNAMVGGRTGEMTLWIDGENFATGAVILLNGEEQNTRSYDRHPEATLISEEAGSKIKPGDRLQVRNPNGALSEVFIYTSPWT
jgi:N-acetylneuraminic acid mutarotase